MFQVSGFRLQKFYFLLLTSCFLLLSGCASTFMTSGKIALQQQDYEKAVQDFKMEIEQNPNNTEAYLWLGKAYGADKSYIEAVDAFNKAQELDSSVISKLKKETYFSWAIYNNAGIELMNQEKWEPSRAAFESAKEFLFVCKPLQIDSLKDGRLKIYNARGLPEEIYCLEVKDVTLFIWTYQEKGYMFVEDKKVGAFDIDTTESRPDAVPPNAISLSEASSTYSNLGYVYSKLENDEKAKECYAKAIALDQKNPQSYFNLAKYYIGRLEYKDAISVLEKAIEWDSLDADITYFLGISYFENKENDKAKEAFKRTISLDPKKENAYFNLGAILIKQKKWSSAINIFEQLLGITPDDKESLIFLAGALSEAKQYKRVIDICTQVIDLVGGDKVEEEGFSDKDKRHLIDAYIYRSGAYSRLGEHKKSKQDYKKVQELERK